MVKKSTCNAGHPGSIPGLGRSSGEENGYPLHYAIIVNTLPLFYKGKISLETKGVFQKRTLQFSTNTKGVALLCTT